MPGMMWEDREPSSSTWSAPRMVTSTWPPRIRPKEVAESKNMAPGMTSTYLLPALDTFRSLVSGVEAAPMPMMPFSDWKMTLTSSGR